MKYEHLFSEGKIGNLTLKNRSVMTAMGTGFGQLDRNVSEKEKAYFVKRAKGGAGLIISGITTVEEECGTAYPTQISAAHDKYLPGLKDLADAVHAAGAKMFIQLQHPGNTAGPAFNKKVVSPSGISAASKVPTVALTLDEIHDIIKKFGEAALRVKKAGFDGVEIHGAHFYLIHQFLSPTYNQRTDEYGGNSENRFRFLKEIIEEVRKTCGDDFPLIVRISMEEYIGETGYHPDYAITICKRLEALGVDGLDITVSGSASPRGQSIEYISYEQGWRRFGVKAVKKCVNIPVIGVSVVREPAFADELIASGDFDFVGSGRNHLADPEWENKAMAGNESSIRRCISCLRCIENLKGGVIAYCSVNPTCGKEDAEKPLVVNGNGRVVAVIGAGVGGMEAAQILAKRGFKVTVFEKSDVLGGQVALAAAVPGKAKMNWLIEYLKNECDASGVEIKMGVAPTVEELKAMKPYAIINATGGESVIPSGIPGADGKIVCTPADILSGRITPEGESVLIVGSGLTGLETAEYIMSKPGNNVILMEMAETIAPTAYIAARVDAMLKLTLDNVIMMPGRQLTSIGEDRVFFTELASGEDRELPVDRVVLSLGVKSADTYGEVLKEACDKVYVVGDAGKPARIQEAVTSGYDIAVALA